MIWLTQIFYWPISAFTKLAFLFFYLRIFPRVELRKYVFGTMGLTFLYWAVYQFGNIFYCTPISLVWQGWDGQHPGKCLDINKFLLSAAPVNILLDLIIIVMPIRDILILSLSWRRKLAIMSIFLVGIL